MRGTRPRHRDPLQVRGHLRSTTEETEVRLRAQDAEVRAAREELAERTRQLAAIHAAIDPISANAIEAGPVRAPPRRAGRELQKPMLGCHLGGGERKLL